MKTSVLKKLNFNKLVLVVIMTIFLFPNPIMAKKVIFLKHITDIPNYTVCDDGPVSITKSEILNSKGIYFSGNETDFASAFRVISFTVTTKINGYEIACVQNNGPAFTTEQINLIKRAKSGGKVYVENIIAIGPEGEKRNLGSIIFKIR